MKRHFLLLLSVCIFSSVYATKLDERYVMKTFDSGLIYFILPFEIPSNAAKTKALSADITYLTTSDSVTMKISVWSAKELSTDSIILEGDEKLVFKDFETFFIEPDGKLWHHRFSFRFPMTELKKIYLGTLPLSLNIYSKDHEEHYGWSIKAWKKEQEWMNKVLHIIERNRKFYM